ncbi:hypothetical protein PTKIN_Ptkin15bG0092000 [Pterospermum kingtungense]
MSRNASTPPVDSQTSKRTIRKWSFEEDVVLVSRMVDLHNIRTHNVDTGNWTSDFGWDSQKNMVTTEDAVWESYLTTAADILEDIALEDNVEINEGTKHKSQFEFGSDDMDILSRILQTSTSSRRRRKTSVIDESFTAATLLGDKLSEIANKLSDSIGSERILQQKLEQLDGVLSGIEGLTKDEMDFALSKIPNHPSQMLVFFSLPPSRKLGWVRMFLSTH